MPRLISTKIAGGYHARKHYIAEEGTVYIEFPGFGFTRDEAVQIMSLFDSIISNRLLMERKEKEAA